MNQVIAASTKVFQITAAAVMTSLVATPAMATQTPTVPEPSSAALLAAGVAGLIVAGRFWSRK